MISKEELEKWAFQLKMDGDCDATDKDIETLITQALDTIEELEKAKRCLPVDKEFEVRGSWIGSVQNYIAHLEESLENASVGNALLERENHHAKVVGHLVDLIIELKAKLSEFSGNAFKEAYESGHTRRVPELFKTREDHPGWFQSEEEKEDAIKNIQQGLDVVKSRASECWDGIYSAIKGRGKRSEGDFTPDLSMSVEEIIEAINNRHANSTPDSDNDCVIGKWIPVSERMPEKNQDVLISVNFDSDLVQPLVCSARYTGSTFRRGDATVKPGSGVEQATHWMPLPVGPKEQDNV